MRNRFPLLAVISMFLLFAGMATAQVTSGNLVGTVKDATGSIVPGASVTVTAQSTGVTSKVTASSSGEFRLTNLAADKYDIAVESTGFQKTSLTGVLVDLNKTSTADITLSVGTSQSVEVSAEAGVVLDTTSTNLSQTFSVAELSSLPSASVGLGVLNLSLLTPGVSSSGAVGIGQGPSVAGQRPRNNNYTLEGIDNNNKGVTGPLIYVPNDAVGSFTLITSQFSPEFGHSSGGQFNQTIVAGTNKFHGKAYEFFQNRNLNAAGGQAGAKIPNPRFDFNRYGGQLGGPILKDKLFFFGSFERQTTGQSGSSYICTPTAAGLNTLGTYAGNFNATNLAQYLKYVPAATLNGGAQVTDATDVACFTGAAGAQTLPVFSDTKYDPNFDGENGPIFGTVGRQDIPLGNSLVSAPSFVNFDALTTGMDYTLSSKDSIRGRYIYNTEGAPDTAASIPTFYTQLAYKWHLISLSEFHSFTPNLTNEFRVGFNRYATATPSGPFAFPGLDAFPNLTFYDQNGLNLGPDGNAPQSTIQNLYQVTNNVSWVKGKHTITMGFDGRKYISPQTFTQRVRGDYQYDYLTEYLHDLVPTSFGERSTGDVIYYGDQTALYGYGNDTWRVLPKLTLNAGLRYEFTAVPVGERAQKLNAAASVPGLINFAEPKPAYKNFAPRFGINFAPDSKTSIRAGFGLSYDVLFDNLGLLSFPPQYSSTNDVNTTVGTVVPGQPTAGDQNFLTGGGLPSGGSGIAQFCLDGTGGTTGVPCQTDVAAQRAATSAFVPNQTTPYAESYTLTIQRVIASKYTAEIGYVGTRGIHLPTQIQLNRQPKTTLANQLFTSTSIVQDTDGDGNALGYATIATAANANNLAAINANSNFVAAYKAAGFAKSITSYQPYSSSNYNGLVANLQRTFQDGLQLDLSYTWSKAMDNATAEVFATVLTPRRPQNSQDLSGDYSRSALDHTHRITLEAVYDLPYFKHSNYLLKNVVGNWIFSPIYTYESPEYATALSGDNALINGDSQAAIDRPIANPSGDRSIGSGVFPVYSSTLAGNCGTNDDGTPILQCQANLVGYSAKNPKAYYVQAGLGTVPTVGRNTIPIRPINNVDFAAYKRISIFDRYAFEFGAQAFNVLNHAQYLPGTVNNINSPGYTTSYAFQTVTTGAAFQNAPAAFSNNYRSLQLSGKIVF